MVTNLYLHKKGFGLVEAVVAISIVAAFIVILGAVNTIYLKISFSQSNILQAAFLAEEGIEAVRFIRDGGWGDGIASLSNGVDYYLAFTGSSWQPTTTPVSVGIFDRRVRFDEVYRDATDNITTMGGTIDPNVRLVTSKVSWVERGATSTKTVSTYITNLFAN